ncbi:hypothetical protein SteCoe_29148 [Stentor coeruleus]|uniref:Peptidase M14 domain-containing protein n=1 Tax=Stentor coeruleus TaxID=5963 RepID=A0A1R2B6X9_9CILI|nr:hypothetical protein SteCoe_29148 [Stentor coeruleus]
MSHEIPFEGPLIEGNYFLEPEELFGMDYGKMQEGWPIPLKYNTQFPVAESTIPGHKYKTIYTGYRPIDSFILHRYFSLMKCYPFIITNDALQAAALASQININKNPDKRPFIGMRPSLSKDYINFDGKFENGNLDRVIAISSKEYDLYIRSDTNAPNKFSWFSFIVTNCAGKGTVRFNVLNMTDSPLLYQKGMRPYVSENDEEWQANVKNIEYGPSKLNGMLRAKNKKTHSMLSFEYDFGPQAVKVHFARSIPYTYSQQLEFIETQIKSSPYFKSKELCKSIGGLSVPVITITNFQTSKARKKYILVTSRLNPGETTSSYIVEGLIKFLLSDNPDSCKSRDCFIYKIIPMVNPEGVVIGNSRSTITGLSIQQKLSEMSDLFESVPKYIKKLAYKIQSRLGIYIYLEFGGTFTNLGSFIHNPHSVKDPQKHFLTKVIAEIINKYSPLSKLIPKDVEQGLRVFPLRNMMEKVLRLESYVCETSVYGYKNEKGACVSHDEKLLGSHGYIIAEAILKYFTLTLMDTNDILRLASPKYSEKKSTYNGSDSSFSEHSENSEYATDVNLIINEIFKEKPQNKNDFNIISSSDDEDINSREFVYASLQEFCNFNSKKRQKKKITLETKIPEAKDMSIENARKYRKSNGSYFKIRKLRSRKYASRQEAEVSNINFSSICKQNRSQSNKIIKTQMKKLPIKAQLIFGHKEKTEQENTRIYEMPRINSVLALKTFDDKDRPKYYKFGPFPNFKKLHSLNFLMTLV